MSQQFTTWFRQSLSRVAAMCSRVSQRILFHFQQNILPALRVGFSQLKRGLKVALPVTRAAMKLIRPVIHTLSVIIGFAFRETGKYCLPILLVFWKKCRRFKIQDETLGDVVDRWAVIIKSYPWVQQLQDASQYDTRMPTLISTCFANILALVFPLALMQVYDRIIPSHSLNTLTFLTIGVVVAFMIEAGLRITRSYINLWADTKYEFLLAKTAFSKLMHAPLYVSENTDVGTRLQQFAILDQMKGFYNTQLLSALFDIPFLLIFLLVIAYVGQWLFLIPLFSTIGVAYWFLRYAKHSEHLLEDKINFEGKESDFIINVLTGIHTVKSIGMEELLIRRHESLQAGGMKINLLSSLHEGDLLTIKTVTSQLTLIITATFGAILVIHGDLAIGGLAACILLAGRVMRPFDRILGALNRLNMINIVRKKLDVIFELPSEAIPTVGQREILQGNITLKNVGFHFGDYANHPILRNINLTIPAHTVVAITGKNQAEKTSILHILATITKPTSGQYLLDQQDVGQYHTYALRKQIAYLNRSGKLFRGTMMDNLSAFDEELIPAARRWVDRLGLNSILSRLPSGYDTYVGEKSVEALPGGVVNLIFIIRALVSKPSIILFDETNISVDMSTRQKLLECLLSLKESTTIVIVANSPATIEMADVVYEFQDGALKRMERGK